MKAGLFTVRALALIILVIATGYSLDRWTWVPLKCAHRASFAGAKLQAAAQMTSHQTRLLGQRIRADLDGCDHLSNVAIPFIRGVADEMTDDPRSAIAEYERALEIDRRPEIYFRLGMAQLAALDHSAAIASFSRACAFDPALLQDIPYGDVRRAVELRLNATYSPNWIN